MLIGLYMFHCNLLGFVVVFLERTPNNYSRKSEKVVYNFGNEHEAGNFSWNLLQKITVSLKLLITERFSTLRSEIMILKIKSYYKHSQEPLNKLFVLFIVRSFTIHK